MALLGRGRVQAARGEDPDVALVAGLRELRDADRPALRGEIHLALAEARRGRDVAAAVTEARAGLAIFERLGARRDADRASALLRSLGVSVRTGGEQGGRDDELLSRREREVVPLLAEGLSNGEIAKRLFLAPKTVEHHVTSILGKLGLRTWAEVAAWAAQRTATRN
jgi:DNA-binding NarL/FixJ family response regulator